MTKLFLDGEKVSNLEPLKDLKLTWLCIPATLVRDLSPLKNTPLTFLDMRFTPVSDLLPLKGNPLKGILLSFNRERDAEVLRSITTLETINYIAAKEFLK